MREFAEIERELRLGLEVGGVDVAAGGAGVADAAIDVVGELAEVDIGVDAAVVDAVLFGERLGGSVDALGFGVG